MSKKVLIADDDAAILDAVSLMLREEGFDVKTQANGNKLYKLEQDLPDVLLLDIWMSGVFGGDICKYLKQQPATKNLPIVLVSANKDTAKIAAESGADDFLAKPFEMDELVEKVKKYTK